VEVVLELGEGRRRAGMGAAKIGRGPQPFTGARGRRRHRDSIAGVSAGP
jgi:hypothetical protein